MLKEVSQTGLHERPRALVLVLLLAPSDWDVLVRLQLMSKRVEGEGSQLLDSEDSDVGLSQSVAFSNEIVVDLA